MGRSDNITSVGLDDENDEWAQANDINISQIVNEAIERKRLSATMSAKEQLQKELTEKNQKITDLEEQLSTLKDERDDIRNEIEEIEAREEDQLQRIEDALEAIMTFKPSLARDASNLQSASQGTGLSPSDLADLVDHIDLHYARATVIVDEDERESKREKRRGNENVHAKQVMDDDVCSKLEEDGLLEEAADDETDDDVEAITHSLTTQEREKLEEWLAERED